ncbi:MULTISPECIES: GLPGLI family protein [Salegentibacter]|uniref:GLPGLI family protein n=1 Tax=Salegentibacter agarivorans TaxID=345907 RepID=A0A1I2MUE2_9FLAO|nr:MULTISPECIES: GLPGLI family protein [Salegentibacter]SFF93097.1 GLPGLI family protein [Salegentibacter agarivorans]
MRSLIMLVLLLSLGNLQAQDQYSYKATYQLEFQEDSTDENSIKSETGVLYLSEEQSRYSSLGKAVKDSLKNMTNPVSMRMDEYNQMTDFKYTIYKDYQENELILAEKVFQYELKYKQDLKQIDWEIQPENKEILGFSVQKATGDFAGRNYVAWFAPELPFSDGPYKFSGLPGLILEISDLKNHYHFSLTAFQELANPVDKLLNLDNYKTVSQQELDQVRDDYDRDPIGTMQKAGIKFGWSEEDETKTRKELSEKYKKRNNPIEL